MVKQDAKRRPVTDAGTHLPFRGHRAGSAPRPAQSAGSGARRARARILFPIALLILGGCAGDTETPAHGQAGQAGGAQPGGHSPDRPPVPVAIAPSFVGDIATHYAATATLAAEKEAEILARVTGVAADLHCEEGDQVRAGATLLRISNDEYRLRLAQAEANTANLTARHERVQGMLEKNLVSAEEFEQVKADLKSARAEEELARLNLSYTNVVAPFSGRVTSRLIDPGRNISVGTPLFVLADFDPLLARVHVPSREFRRLEADQPVELVLDSSRQRLTGRIKLVSPIIDPTSGTIKITIEVNEYPADTRPGDFAEVRIVTERRTGSTLVPKAAVVTDRGDQVVYVAADSTAERRVVEIGFEDDRNAEILSGIAPGELIVVKGQRSLRHGSPIKVLEDGSAGNRSPMAGPGGQRPSGKRPGGGPPGSGRPGGAPGATHAPPDSASTAPAAGHNPGSANRRPAPAGS